MRILVCHNQYLIHGGEEQVVRSEIQLLRDHGHAVFLYQEDSQRIEKLGKIRTALRTFWSIESYKRVTRLIKEFRPDVIHVHNFLPLLSPSIYYAASNQNVPVIQTLHNFRFSCLNGIFLRDGKICEQCLGKKFALPGVRHRCYRESFLGSFVVAAMFATHRFVGTWRKKVAAYIVLSEFNYQKMLAIGLPEEKLFIKPNFASITGKREKKNEHFALYLGRLSPEKGIQQLLSAWEGIEYPLKIIGDGPLLPLVKEASQLNQHVTFYGRLENEIAMKIVNEAAFMIVPSICYDVTKTIIEAYAHSVPVLSSNLGSMDSMVEEGVTGLKFDPNNHEDFRAKINWAITHENEIIEMGLNAKCDYKKHYSAEINYQRLIKIYQFAVS